MTCLFRPDRPMPLILICLLAASAATMLAGCQTRPAARETRQPAPPPQRSVNAFIAQQTAAGARDDGMIQEHHFNGASLSALGRDKLDRMAAASASAGRPLNYYLNLPEDDPLLEQRGQAVREHLLGAGIPSDRLHAHHGPNPDALSPAALGAADLQRLRPRRAD